MPGSLDNEKPKENEGLPSKSFKKQRKMKVPAPLPHTIPYHMPGGGILSPEHIYLYIYMVA